MKRLAALLVLLPLAAGAADTGQWLHDLRCRPKARALLGEGDCLPDQVLTISGSPVMAFYMRPLAEAFEKLNPGIKVEISSRSSAASLVAVDHGAIDLAAVARDLGRKEYKPELRVTLVGRDGLVAVVNRDNPLSDLSQAQLRAMFLGETSRWPNGREVHVVTRNQGSASLQSFEEIVLGGGKIAGAVQEAAKSAEMVSDVAADPDAIGFVGLQGLTPQVKALTIDGVPETEITILSSRYPLVRSLNLVEEGEEAGEPKRLFVEFAAGPEGQALIEKTGAVRVN